MCTSPPEFTNWLLPHRAAMVCLYASSSLRARAPLRGTDAKLEDVAAAHFVGLPVCLSLVFYGSVKAGMIEGGCDVVLAIEEFGNLFGTPILNQPQVGILAIGAIQKVPAVVETPEGDVIAIRYKLMLSHSFDHRVVNGALGGMFVQRVAKYLEQWDVNREI